MTISIWGDSFNRRDFLGLATSIGYGCVANCRASAQNLGVFYNCVQVEPWYAEAQKNGAADRAAALQLSVESIVIESERAQQPIDAILAEETAHPAPGLESAAPGVVSTARKLLEAVQKNLGKGSQPNVLESIGGKQAVADVPRLEAVFERQKRWRRPVVTVQFLHSAPRFQNAVMEAAKRWGAHCCIEFRQTRKRGDIRVSFDQGIGHCSLIGVDSVNGTVGGGLGASFNINPGDVASQPDHYLMSIALHEFGHAVGLHHEHQNVNGRFRWNEAAVINTLSRQGWDNRMIQQNVFQRISDTRVFEITRFDPESIMIYPWPRGTVTGPDQPPTTWNRRISPTDESTVRGMYGCPASQSTDPERREPAEKIVVKTDPRKTLSPAKAKVLEINVVTGVEFDSEHEMIVCKFVAPRKDSSRVTTDEFVFETIDGATAGKDRELAVPVCIEFFSDPTDFYESKSNQVSKLGVAPSDDDLGSVGIEDAYLRRPIVSETSSYLLIRPLRRQHSGQRSVHCRLLVRRAGIERPQGIDSQAFGTVLKKKKP